MFKPYECKPLPELQDHEGKNRYRISRVNESVFIIVKGISRLYFDDFKRKPSCSVKAKGSNKSHRLHWTI